ncbi:homoserine kinase [Gammaproteobacteria bacterium]|nr:homoserine kinase [Gammaproteobacteria bacterium]
MQKFAIRVPATSANLGPGFDSFGLALTLYNTFHIRQSKSYEIHFTNKNIELDPENNLILKAYSNTCTKHNWEQKTFTLNIENNLPFSSGLGSSSTAVVAGVVIAYMLNDHPLDKASLLLDALDIETHIDNIGAAIYGGFIVGMVDIAKVRKITVDKPLVCWVITPHMEINTDLSRQTLPNTVSMNHSVHNISHAAAVAIDIAQGNFANLRLDMTDKLHQEYRVGEKLQYLALQTKLYSCNQIYSISLSGSGPSLLVLASQITDSIRKVVQMHFTDINIAYTVHELDVDNQGLTIL